MVHVGTNIPISEVSSVGYPYLPELNTERTVLPQPVTFLIREYGHGAQSEEGLVLIP